MITRKRKKTRKKIKCRFNLFFFFFFYSGVTDICLTSLSEKMEENTERILTKTCSGNWSVVSTNPRCFEGCEKKNYLALFHYYFFFSIAWTATFSQENFYTKNDLHVEQNTTQHSLDYLLLHIMEYFAQNIITNTQNTKLPTRQFSFLWPTPPRTQETQHNA